MLFISLHPIKCKNFLLLLKLVFAQYFSVFLHIAKIKISGLFALTIIQ